MFAAKKLIEFIFGWSKASKCKDLLKLLRNRIKILRYKREAIVKQERSIIAQILKNGYDPASILSRAEELFKDQSFLAAYDLIDQFTELIILNMPYIRKCKDCPNDINEAISTLVFASARCANLPELQELRKLFCKRYGSCFEVEAVEAMPGNHVNEQIREKLSAAITEDVKLNLIQEIAQEFDLKHQVKDVNVLGCGYNAGLNNVYERDVGVVQSDFDVVGKIKSYSFGNIAPEIVEETQIIPIVSSLPQYDTSSNILNQKRLTPTTELEGSKGSSDMDTSISTDEDNASKKITGVSEHFSNFDREEQHSSAVAKRRTPQRRRRRGDRLAAGKILRTDIINGDVESLQYYDGVSDHSDIDTNSSCSKREPRKPKTGNQSSQANARKRITSSSRSAKKPPKQYTKYHNKKSLSFTDCCLDHPRNFLANEINLKKFNGQEDATCVESNAGKNRGGDPNHVNHLQIRMLPPPYTRAVSMPVERPKMEGMDKTLGGCGSASSNPTHPKLPDYDDLAATFTALKKDHAMISTVSACS